MLKIKRAVTLIFVTFLTIYSKVTFSKGLQGEMYKFRLSSCSSESNLCIEINAKRAATSDLQNIYFLRDVEVTTINSKNTKRQTENVSSAYIDFSSNYLVLLTTENGLAKEKVIELARLKEPGS